MHFAFINETIILMLVADIQKLQEIFPQLCVQSFRQNAQYIPAIEWQQVSDDMMASTKRVTEEKQKQIYGHSLIIIKQKGKHNAVILRETERRPVPTD